MKQPTEEQHSQLKIIEGIIGQSVKGLDYQVGSEFVANTNQSREYLGFITLVNEVGSISHNTGIPLNDIGNTDKWVETIKKEITYNHVNIFDL